MEERPVSHRSIDADEEDDLLTQWKKWRRAAAMSRRSARARVRRVAVPASPTCPCGGRMRRVPKPKPAAGEERVADGACGGLAAPVLPPATAAWYPYDLRCNECDGETCWRRQKPAFWAADWKAARPWQRWRPYPSFADLAAALGDLRLGAGAGDGDHSGDVDMIASSFENNMTN